MNRKEIIFVLLNDFADWEGAFVAPVLNQGIEPVRPAKYKIKIFSLIKDPVTSIGSIRVLPDFDINTMPEEYAGLIEKIGESYRFDKNVFCPVS